MESRNTEEEKMKEYTVRYYYRDIPQVAYVSAVSVEKAKECVSTFYRVTSFAGVEITK